MVLNTFRRCTETFLSGPKIFRAEGGALFCCCPTLCTVPPWFWPSQEVRRNADVAVMRSSKRRLACITDAFHVIWCEYTHVAKYDVRLLKLCTAAVVTISLKRGVVPSPTSCDGWSIRQEACNAWK